MRKILFSLSLLVAAVQAVAQEKNKGVTILPELGLHYNINSPGVKDSGASKGMLRVENTFGFTAGIALRKQAGPGIVLLSAVGVRLDRQKVFRNTGVHSEDNEASFTNLYLYLKLLAGYSIGLKSNSRIDICAGLFALYSLRNEEPVYQAGYTGYTDPVTGKPQQYLSSFSAISWGDTRKDLYKLGIPFIPNVVAQVAYVKEGIWGKQTLRVGVEFSTRIDGTDRERASNEASMRVFDRNNNRLAASSYRDKCFSIGLIAALSL
jgi:hypothetical protein